MKSVTVLGSTGSIGESTLRVLRNSPDLFRVSGLTCNNNFEKIVPQIEEFRPAFVAMAEEGVENSSEFRELRERFPQVEFFSGAKGVQEVASVDVDITVSAIVGAAGLLPSLKALESSGTLALANKETLVMAGELFMKRVEECGVKLLPVDSEHSAIFSLLHGMEPRDVERLIITASGGSLRDYPLESLGGVTPQEALKHPTWNMGGKITIDSATLMNKGLEVIEARHLFGFDYDRIAVVVHPESIIHSMVESVDGAIYAHLGVADMALPISNALFYPEKRENPFGRLDLVKTGSLSFREVDHRRYPSLNLCYEAGRSGGLMPAILNAANEVAVYAFLAGRLGFDGIYKTVESVLSVCENHSSPNLEMILEWDCRAREIAESLIKESLIKV